MKAHHIADKWHPIIYMRFVIWLAVVIGISTDEGLITVFAVDGIGTGRGCVRTIFARYQPGLPQNSAAFVIETCILISQIDIDVTPALARTFRFGRCSCRRCAQNGHRQRDRGICQVVYAFVEELRELFIIDFGDFG